MARKVKPELLHNAEELQSGIENPVYVPDIPAQMIEESRTIEHTDVVESEVGFLKRILHIQHNGGFGRHLDDIINERIKMLQ